jgi:hypothetical protein
MLKINTVTMEDKIKKILKNSYTNFGEFDESKAVKELLDLFSVIKCKGCDDLATACEECKDDYYKWKKIK